MLRWRLLGAAAILIPLLAIVYADYAWNFGLPGIWLFFPALAAILLATEEVLSLLSHQEHRPLSWVVYTGVTLVVLTACTPVLYEFGGETYPKDCPLGKLGFTFSMFALMLLLAFDGGRMCCHKPGGVIASLAPASFVI